MLLFPGTGKLVLTYPSYDIIIQGMAGLMSINGLDGGDPTKVEFSIADVTAGMYSAISTLGALNYRNRTLLGQFIDISMFDCIVSFLGNPISHFLVSREKPLPLGNRHMAITPFSTFPTSDDNILIAIGNNNLWAKFCKVINRQDFVQDPRFQTNESRCKNWEQLHSILNGTTETKKSESWIKIFTGERIPCGPINDVSAVIMDPQVKAREMIIDEDHPVIGNFKMVNSPIKMGITSSVVYKSSPF